VPRYFTAAGDAGRRKARLIQMTGQDRNRHDVDVGGIGVYVVFAEVDEVGVGVGRCQ
jgi:hypothetical protein